MYQQIQGFFLSLWKGFISFFHKPSDAEGSGAEGSDAEGSGAEGSGAEGSGAEGSGAEGSGAEGSDAEGSGASEEIPLLADNKYEFPSFDSGN